MYWDSSKYLERFFATFQKFKYQNFYLSYRCLIPINILYKIQKKFRHHFINFNPIKNLNYFIMFYLFIIFIFNKK
jgi:hypothetical protein